MKRAALLSVLLAVTAVAGTLEGLRAWSFIGEDRASFTAGRDEKVRHGGKASAFLEAASEPKAFGSIVQSVEADDYRGKRVRFTAFVKASDVKGFAGLFMRVEGARPDATLAFDNMQSRPIKGSTEWTQHKIVLDVPASAKRLHFGLLLSGSGRVWIDDAALQPTGDKEPTTGIKPTEGPKNLAFDE